MGAGLADIGRAANGARTDGIDRPDRRGRSSSTRPPRDLTPPDGPLHNRLVFALAYALFLAAIVALLRSRRRLAMGLAILALAVSIAVLRSYMTDPLQVNL